MNKKPIVVAGVPEHFNLPWHLAIESGKFNNAGIDVDFQNVPGGTGAMMTGLREKKFDVALVLFEGCVKDILKDNPSRIVKVYVSSPLIWGIHVPNDSEINNVEEMKGQRYAISRYGSGSHLMAIVDASERGWETDNLLFEKVGNLSGAREALANDDAEIFFWERFTTAPYVQAGEFRCIAERRTLWPAFAVCVREEILESRGNDIAKMLEVINQSCADLMANPLACELISQRYNLILKDVREWFEQTTWSTDFEKPARAIESTKLYLKKLDLVTEEEANATDVWFDLNYETNDQKLKNQSEKT